jgi:hypothetical protein
MVEWTFVWLVLHVWYFPHLEAPGITMKNFPNTIGDALHGMTTKYPLSCAVSKLQKIGI